MVGLGAGGGDIGAHPEGGGGGALVSGYEDVCALADAEGDDLSCVWFLGELGKHMVSRDGENLRWGRSRWR